MLNGSKIAAIKTLAERGVGGEKNNAKAILDKLQDEHSKKCLPRTVNFALAAECAVDNWAALYLAYIGIAERIAKDVIWTEIGTSDFIMPQTFNGCISFMGTEAECLNVQDKVNRQITNTIKALESAYQQSCTVHGVLPRKPCFEYGYQSV